METAAADLAGPRSANQVRWQRLDPDFAMPATALASPSITIEAPRGAPALRQKRQRHPAALLGAALAIAALSMALIGTREKIVRIAPSIAPLYAALGLPVNLTGLNIRAVRSTLLEDGVSRVLAIEGEIANIRGSVIPIPELHVALRNGDGREIYTWTTPPPKAKLAAGESVAFRARLTAPPAAATEVSVRFAATETK